MFKRHTPALTLCVLSLTLFAFEGCSCDEEPTEAPPANSVNNNPNSSNNNNPDNANCPEGALGCPCRADDSCDTLGGVALECVDAVCAEPDDANNPNSNNPNSNNPNSNNPNSNNPNSNNPNSNNMFEGTGLSVSDESARSCEAVVRDVGGVIGETRFDDGVKGRALRRGERIAIAFLSRTDAALPAGSVQFEVEGDAAGLEIIQSKCFDRAGGLIDGLEVALVR